MAPKVSTVARNLFLQELDKLPRGIELKRKANEEGGDSKKIARRYMSLKMAEWFSCTEDDQDIFLQKAKSLSGEKGATGGSQPTLKVLFSQNLSLSPRIDDSFESQVDDTVSTGSSGELTQPATESQLQEAGRGVAPAMPPPSQPDCDAWPHDRQPDGDESSQPIQEHVPPPHCHAATTAINDQVDGVQHYLQHVKKQVSAGNLMAAFAALEALSMDVGYVGDEFMEGFLAWALATTSAKSSAGNQVIQRDCHATAPAQQGCGESLPPTSVDDMWKSLASSSAFPLPLVSDIVAGYTASAVNGGADNTDNGQFRRLLKPIPPRGRLPDKDDILGLAAKCGLYVHESQFKPLMHGSSAVGFQLATPCLSSYINVWPSSGRVHIAGRDRSVGLRFVQSFTMADPKPPRSRGPPRPKARGNLVSSRPNLSPQEALQRVASMGPVPA